jgi:AAA ATPase domain
MSSDLGTPYAGERIDEPATRSPACPACGRHSQPEAAFCAFCGTALVHQRVPGPPVFAAVATAIDGRTAYEVLSEVGPLFESLGAVFEGVSQHPATLVALFPPREDAAAVAARAAIDASERCPKARIGIDASEVTEQSDQDAIWQDLIDRSAQLGSAGEPGMVVASDAIPALTEGAAVVEPVDGMPGATWLRTLRDLSATVEVDGPPATEHAAGEATPFVGRDRELAELRSRFDVVVEEGRAACVAVVGEPGIGTTRLAEAFLGSLGDARRFVLRCDRELDGGIWPLATLVETFAGVSPWDDPAVAREKLERLLAATREPERAVERIAAVLAIDDAEPLGDETRWAVRTVIEAAILGPSVLLVDGIDRAAFGFAAFLGDVARALRSTPLLIVGTAAAEPPGVPDTIVLSLLDEPASRALIASRLGAVDADASTAVVTTFGRSPLLLEHGLAMLVETSALVREADRWLAAADLATRAAGSARDVIGERVRALPDDVHAAAALAAVCSLIAIEDVDGEIEAQFASLVEMSFLAPGGEGTLRWTHELVREAAAGGAKAAGGAGTF